MIPPSNNNNKYDHFGCGISIPVTVFITVCLATLFYLDYNDYHGHYTNFELSLSNRTVLSFPSYSVPDSWQITYSSLPLNSSDALLIESIATRKSLPATIKFTIIASVTFTFIMYSVCRVCSWSETRLRQRRHYSKVAPALHPVQEEEHGDLELDEIEDNISREEKSLNLGIGPEKGLQKVVIKQDPVKIQQLLRSSAAATAAAVASVVAGFEGRK